MQRKLLCTDAAPENFPQGGLALRSSGFLLYREAVIAGCDLAAAT